MNHDAATLKELDMDSSAPFDQLIQQLDARVGLASDHDAFYLKPNQYSISAQPHSILTGKPLPMEAINIRHLMSMLEFFGLDRMSEAPGGEGILFNHMDIDQICVWVNAARVVDLLAKYDGTRKVFEDLTDEEKLRSVRMWVKFRMNSSERCTAPLSPGELHWMGLPSDLRQSADPVPSQM